jgi:hypothetical protein
MNHRRFFLGCFLLSLLILLTVYYSLDHNNHDPDNQYILDHFEQFNMTSVTMDGVVTNVDRTNNTLQVQVTQSPKSTIIVSTTENVSTTQKGDTVEVYGVLTSRNHVTAEKLLISSRWASELIYVRSLPAIPFALYLFFRSYRFNRTTRRFERRQHHA